MINAQIVKTVRAIEALLKSEDINPLHTEKALSCLSGCVLPNHVKAVYTSHVRPLHVYLDYFNNFISVESFAEHHSITVKQAELVIELNSAKLEEIVYLEREARKPKNKSSTFYAWVGQNATIGTQHAITGRLSMYGDLVAFSSMKKRDHFVSEYYYQNFNLSSHKTNKHAAKSKFCAGMSKYVYDEYLQEINLQVDEKYNSFFNVEGVE